MESEQLARQRKTTFLHVAMEANTALQKIEDDFPDNPQAMSYFYSLCRAMFEKEPLLPEGKKVVGTMCVQVPLELIYAAGAVPLRLCSGVAAYDQVGMEFMPAKACSVVRATTGMLQMNKDSWGEALQAVIIPTTCDQKKKSCQIIEEMGYTVYPLEMPASKDSEAARFYWQESVKKFTLDLEKMTGTRITRTGVRQAIARIGQAAALYRQLHEMRKNDPPLILGKDMLLVANSFFFADLENWLEAVKKLLAELTERKSKGFAAGNRHAPRLLLTGSPSIFPNLKLPVLLEQSGGVIVADELCSSSRLLYDTVAYDEPTLNDMIPALADRSLKPCSCPCLIPNTDRLRRLTEMIKSFAVDGVVYQAFAGCTPYEMEQKQVGRMLADNGIPMLYVETDYSPEDMGQLSTRVEAFIESIKARKRKGMMPKRSRQTEEVRQ